MGRFREVERTDLFKSVDNIESRVTNAVNVIKSLKTEYAALKQRSIDETGTFENADRTIINTVGTALDSLIAGI